MTQVSVELREANGTLVAALPNAFDVTFQAFLDEMGNGSFRMPIGDALIPQFTVGREAWFYLDAVHAFDIRVDQPPTMVLVDPGEEAAEHVEVKGRGVGQAFDGARIYPQKGLSDPLVPQHRIYSFASPDFPNTGSWVAATQLFLQSFLDPIRHDFVDRILVNSDGTQTLLDRTSATAPIGWPVPSAYWIWGTTPTTPLGFNYFRKSVTLGARTLVKFAVAADNYYTLFLDGTPILGDTGQEGETTWKEYRQLTMTLPAGTYELAAVVENIDNGLTNPAAFLFALYTTTDQDVVTSVLCVSDNSWSSLAYPAAVPGWTPGQVVLNALTEAQARGALTGWTCDATATVDSHGNAWAVVGGSSGFMPMFSIPVGASMTEMLTSLVSQGRLDWRVTTGHVLHLFNPSEVTAPLATLAVTGVVATQNIVSLELTPGTPTFTAFLVKWSGGPPFDVADATAVAAYGRIEGFVAVDAFNVADATRLANVVLADSTSLAYSHAVTVQPVGTADVPMVGFTLGDFVTAPNVVMTGVSVRVWSISVTQTNMGRAVFTIELNRRLKPPELESQQLLQLIGQGVTGPRETKISALSSTKPIGT